MLLFSDNRRVTSLIARASSNVAEQPASKAEAKGPCGAGAAFGRLKRRPGAIRKPFPQKAVTAGGPESFSWCCLS